MYACNKCNKFLSTPYNLKVHQLRCKTAKTAADNAAAAADNTAAAADNAAAAADVSTRTVVGECSILNDNSTDYVVLEKEPLKLSKKAMVFVHPFTCNISGPSKSGKTVFAKQLLESNLIQPPPQRIIYVYKRWQPLYTDIQRQLPHVRFICGIPLNIDSDDFLDSNVRNLIILDDQMTSAASNASVAELYACMNLR